jgi:nicotinamide-nucleotide amidase
MVPEGAEVLENPRGTAPGLWLEDKGRMVALLPGPPRELKPLFLEQVLPRLQKRANAVRMFHRELRVTGLGESHVEERIRPVYTRHKEVHTTILATPGEVQIHLRSWNDEAAQTNTLLDEIVRSFELALGDRIFAHAATPLEEVVAQLLVEHRATIAAAESCTGGLLAERLTRIPGSSNYFLGGVVCYSNEMKTCWADVPAELIAAKGAVSSAVAIALAEGIRRQVRSTLGVGITGIAGPSGGSEEKPVGTVHIAVAGPGGTKEKLVHLPGDREAIRFYASQLGLDMVRMHFLYSAHAQPRRVSNS